MAMNDPDSTGAKLLEDAICWKYEVDTNTPDFNRILRRLRNTDRQDLVWEYEDHLFSLDDAED